MSRSDVSVHFGVQSNLELDFSEPNDDVCFSICVPTYGRTDYLSEALESVRSLKVSVNYEVVIVDNNPETDLEKIQLIKGFNDLPIRYFRNERNIGMFPNWNKCLELAMGRYVTLLHDDDVLELGILDNLEFAIDKRADLVGSCVKIWDQRELDLTFINIARAIKNTIFRQIFPKSLTVRKLFLRNAFMGTLGVVVRKEFLAKSLGFRSEYFPSSDYAFWMECVMLGASAYKLSNKSGKYRIAINESLKPEVVAAFPEMNRKLRTQWLKKVVDNSKIGKELIRILYLEEKKWISYGNLGDTGNIRSRIVVHVCMKYWRLIKVRIFSRILRW